MRKWLVLIISGLIISVSFTSFAKELKIGYVNIFKVFNEYEKTKEYDAKLEKETKKIEKELSVKKEAIEKIQNKLSLLKEAEKKKEEEKLREEIIGYRELEKEALINVKQERDGKMKEIVEDINKIVKEYAKNKGYDLVINENVVLYGDKIMDMTEDILKISNQKYKKK